MPEYLVEDAAKVVSEEAQMVHFYEDDFEHKWTFWNTTVCCLCKEFATMAEYFQSFLASGEAGQLLSPIARIRFKLDKMITDISDVFRNVSFNFLNKSLTSRWVMHICR
jgi:hypothetical protein